MSSLAPRNRLTDDGLVARTVVASALSSAWRDPVSRPDTALSAADFDVLREAWDLIRTECADLDEPQLSIGELTPPCASIEPLIDWLAAPRTAQMSAYDHVFGLVTSSDCPPYETDYCHWEDPTYRANQLADVAGFYRAFGVEPGGALPDRPDHVAIELEFIAFLYQKSAIALAAGDSEHADLCREAREAFVRDHAGWWMPTLARCVQRRIERQSNADGGTAAPSPLVATLNGIADLLRAWAALMRTDAGLPPSRAVIAPYPAAPHPEGTNDVCSSCYGPHPGTVAACCTLAAPAPSEDLCEAPTQQSL